MFTRGYPENERGARMIKKLLVVVGCSSVQSC